MTKYFCSLCGTEIKCNLPDMDLLPRITEKRISTTGDEIEIMVWVNFKVLIGSLCPTCMDMYIEKLLTCLATTRKANK